MRRNSANSSKNSTPLCANEISPGTGILPPPNNPALLIEWCGARNGRKSDGISSFINIPAVEYILIVSMNSSNDNSGMIVGIRLAIIDFPDPGDPTINKL